MHGQLGTIVRDLESATARLRTLRHDVPDQAWSVRPAPARWSPAECIAHLNLTSATLLPLLREGLQTARTQCRRATPRYRRNPLGWLIWKALSPSCALKTTAAPELVPDVRQPLDALVTDFERLQAGLIACVSDAEGLPIDRVTLTSPFKARVRYNLYTALTLVPQHQHRHLRQAERAASWKVAIDSNGASAPVRRFSTV